LIFFRANFVDWGTDAAGPRDGGRVGAVQQAHLQHDPGIEPAFLSETKKEQMIKKKEGRG
jgi:hypothetical protein